MQCVVLQEIGFDFSKVCSDILSGVYEAVTIFILPFTIVGFFWPSSFSIPFFRWELARSIKIQGNSFVYKWQGNTGIDGL